jgi:hypothetical protein
MARMQRRRSYMQNRMGMRQDFQQAGEPEPQYAEPVPAAPGYAAELEQLAQLRDQGVITAEDFEAKKKQLLGI